MIHMVLAELKKPGLFEAGEEMHRIVDHVVNQVAQHETTGKCPGLIAQQQIKKTHQQDR